MGDDIRKVSVYLDLKERDAWLACFLIFLLDTPRVADAAAKADLALIEVKKRSGVTKDM